MENSVKKVPFRFEQNVTQKSSSTSIKLIQPSICVIVALAPFYRLDFQDYFAPHSAKLTQPFLWMFDLTCCFLVRKVKKQTKNVFKILTRTLWNINMWLMRVTRDNIMSQITSKLLTCAVTKEMYFMRIGLTQILFSWVMQILRNFKYTECVRN